ncbi:MAG: hypothetical protein O9353_08145, partial [Bacteroidia bacterium]|nr:hypothetical protein [Bacteroidia bacterium]
ERFPIIITIGAALLGFLAGEMLLTDPAVTAQFGAINEHAVTAGGILGAVLVVALGTYLAKRQKTVTSACSLQVESPVPVHGGSGRVLRPPPGLCRRDYRVSAENHVFATVRAAVMQKSLVQPHPVC